MASRGKSQDQARKRIIKARGHKCERCGFPGYIVLHHIKDFVLGGGHEDDNVILLCELHHAEAHGINKTRYFDSRCMTWNGLDIPTPKKKRVWGEDITWEVASG